MKPMVIMIVRVIVSAYSLTMPVGERRLSNVRVTLIPIEAKSKSSLRDVSAMVKQV